MVSGSRPTAALAALLLVAAGSGRAAAEGDAAGLARARAELAELRYDDALATLDGTLSAGDSGPIDVAEIHLLRGEVLASLGRRAAAEKAFRHALAIEPTLELRRGLSPKIGRPFRRARKALRAAAPLAVAHRVVGRDPTVIALVVTSDPFEMVAGARASYRAADGTAGQVATSARVGGAAAKGIEARYDLELPPGTDRFTVAAVDQHGNRLVELGTTAAPLSLPPEPAAAPAAASASAGGSAAAPADLSVSGAAPDEGTPIYASWVAWGGLAVVAGGVGLWAGLGARSAVDELDDIRGSEFEVEFSDAKRTADRAESRSLVANLCFAGAGATAVVAGVLFFRERARGSRSEAAAVAPMLGPDRVGLAASLRF